MDRQQRALYPRKRCFRHIVRDTPSFIKQAFQHSNAAIGTRVTPTSRTHAIAKCFNSAQQVLKSSFSLDTFKHLYDYNGVQIYSHVRQAGLLRCQLSVDCTTSKVGALFLNTRLYSDWLLGCQAVEICRLGETSDLLELTLTETRMCGLLKQKRVLRVIRSIFVDPDSGKKVLALKSEHLLVYVHIVAQEIIVHVESARYGRQLVEGFINFKTFAEVHELEETVIPDLCFDNVHFVYSQDLEDCPQPYHEESSI